MQVWHFSEGLAQSIPDADGRFRSDKAYVVLAPPTTDEGQQRLYLWAGNDAAQDAKSTAAKHASELKETLGAAYLRQAQGQESDEFKQLFASFSVVEAAADPVTEAVPPQVGGADGGDVALGGSEEGGEGDEHEGEDDAAEAEAGSPTSTGGKKKKRRPKKKGAQGGSQPAEVGGTTVGSPRGAEDAPTPAAGSPRQPGSPPAARPSTPPVTASPLASPRAAVASPRTSQLHADAPPFTPRSMRARAATPFGVPEPSSPAAPRSASPRAAQSSPTAAASKPARAADEGASPTAPAPVAAATATPPKPASPKLSVEESGPESVAKAKQQIMGKLSGSLTDPLGQKQQQEKQANGAARGKSGTTFMAESAKAWGGVASGDTAAPPPQASEVKVKPGEKTFGYDELKALRAESGIDMTHKEAYLSDAEFEKVFGKDRAAFSALPAWRQQMAKKDKGLW